MFELALTWVIAFLLKAELLHGEYADIYTCVSIITHVPTHAWEGEINLYGSVRWICEIHYSVPTGMDAWKLIIIMTTYLVPYMVKRPIVVLLLLCFVLYIVRISLFSMKCWFKAKVTHVSKEPYMLLHDVIKKGNFQLQVSLREEIWGKGKPAMDAVVPWQCNYSLISNKNKANWWT